MYRIKRCLQCSSYKNNTRREKDYESYLYQVLKSSPVQNFIISNSERAAQAGINPKVLADFQIPLPQLEKQQEIVDEIEQYQKVIDGARQVIENLSISIEPEPH